MTSGYTGTTGLRIALERSGWFENVQYVVKVMNSVCRDENDPKFSPVQLSKTWIWGKKVLTEKAHFIFRKLQKNSDSILSFSWPDLHEVVDPYLDLIDNIHIYWPETYSRPEGKYSWK